MNKEKKKELKIYQRIRLKFILKCTALLVISIFLFCTSVFLLFFSIINRESSIDDRYGKLDTNTKMVLEKRLNSVMKEKKIILKFSYLTGDDINEYYFQEVTKNSNALLIYYNENTNNIKLKTHHPNFCNYDVVIESNKTDLCNNLISYINTLNTTIEENKFYIYFSSESLFTITTLTILILMLIFNDVMAVYITTHKTKFKYAKRKIKTLKQDLNTTYSSKLNRK